VSVGRCHVVDGRGAWYPADFPWSDMQRSVQGGEEAGKLRLRNCNLAACVTCSAIDGGQQLEPEAGGDCGVQPRAEHRHLVPGACMCSSRWQLSGMRYHLRASTWRGVGGGVSPRCYVYGGDGSVGPSRELGHCCEG
jgi:hypothetical protein